MSGGAAPRLLAGSRNGLWSKLPEGFRLGSVSASPERIASLSYRGGSPGEGRATKPRRGDWCDRRTVEPGACPLLASCSCFLEAGEVAGGSRATKPQRGDWCNLSLANGPAWPLSAFLPFCPPHERAEGGPSPVGGGAADAGGYFLAAAVCQVRCGRAGRPRGRSTATRSIIAPSIRRLLLLIGPKDKADTISCVGLPSWANPQVARQKDAGNDLAHGAGRVQHPRNRPRAGKRMK